MFNLWIFRHFVSQISFLYYGLDFKFRFLAIIGIIRFVGKIFIKRCLLLLLRLRSTSEPSDLSSSLKYRFFITFMSLSLDFLVSVLFKILSADEWNRYLWLARLLEFLNDFWHIEQNEILPIFYYKNRFEWIFLLSTIKFSSSSPYIDKQTHTLWFQRYDSNLWANHMGESYDYMLEYIWMIWSDDMIGWYDRIIWSDDMIGWYDRMIWSDDIGLSDCSSRGPQSGPFGVQVDRNIL